MISSARRNLLVGFVLPTGYSFNLDGTTLYLSLASIFVAQAAGVQLTWTQQILMLVAISRREMQAGLHLVGARPPVQDTVLHCAQQRGLRRIKLPFVGDARPPDA